MTKDQIGAAVEESRQRFSKKIKVEVEIAAPYLEWLKETYLPDLKEGDPYYEPYQVIRKDVDGWDEPTLNSWLVSLAAEEMARRFRYERDKDKDNKEN